MLHGSYAHRPVINGLARLAGMEPSLLLGHDYANIGEYLRYALGTDTFFVTIGGRTMVVWPIQPVR